MKRHVGGPKRPEPDSVLGDYSAAVPGRTYEERPRRVEAGSPACRVP